MPHSQVAQKIGLAIAIRSIVTCLPSLLLLILLLLMLMPMLMMLALTMLLLLDAFDDVAYAVIDDPNADAIMLNVACDLVALCLCYNIDANVVAVA